MTKTTRRRSLCLKHHLPVGPGAADETEFEDALARTHPGFLAIARKDSGDYVVYVPNEQRPFVDRYHVARDGTTKCQRHQSLGQAWRAWEIRDASHEFATWPTTARPASALTPAQVHKAVAYLRERSMARRDVGSPIRVAVDAADEHGAFVVDHDDLELTAQSHEFAGTSVLRYFWARGRDGEVTLTESTRGVARELWVSQGASVIAPWQRRPACPVVWEDPAAVATVAARQRVFEAQQLLSVAQEQLVSRAVNVVVEQWKRRAEAVAFAAFAAEGGTVEEWPIKQMTIWRSLLYPYTEAQVHADLIRVVAGRVMTRRSLHGVTVGDAFAQHTDPAAPALAAVPDDLAALTFVREVS